MVRMRALLAGRVVGAVVVVAMAGLRWFSDDGAFWLLLLLLLLLLSRARGGGRVGGVRGDGDTLGCAKKAGALRYSLGRGSLGLLFVVLGRMGLGSKGRILAL
jgi:hypothetical protein